MRSKREREREREDKERKRSTRRRGQSSSPGDLLPPFQRCEILSKAFGAERGGGRRTLKVKRAERANDERSKRRRREFARQPAAANVGTPPSARHLRRAGEIFKDFFQRASAKKFKKIHYERESMKE